MRPSILTVLLSLVLFSCDHEKAKQAVFQKTPFDLQVIANLPLYDSLKNIMVNNIDTIFKFKDSRHFVYHGDTKRTTQENADFYIFNFTEPGRSEDGIDNMPAFLYPNVERIYRKLGKDNIFGFEFRRDSSLEIGAKSIYKENINASVNHQLIWKTKIGLSSDDKYIKDTTIGFNWTYIVSIDDHQD